MNALQFPQDSVLHNHIQGRGWLVGDNHGGVAGQGHGDYRSLAHTAAELVGVSFHQLRVQPHHAEQASYPTLGRGDGRLHPVGFNGFHHLLTDLIHRVQRVHRRLKHHGDTPPTKVPDLLFGQRYKVLTVQDDLPRHQSGIVGQQTHQAIGDGSLAAAGLPHQPQRLARVQVKANVLHRLDHTLTGQIVQSKVHHLQDRLGLHHRH